MGKIELTESNGGGSQRNIVGRHMRLQLDNAFAPGQRFPVAREFRGICHDAAGCDILRVQLQETTRHEHCALVIAAGKEVSRLFKKVLFVPGLVTAETPEGEN